MQIKVELLDFLFLYCRQWLMTDLPLAKFQSWVEPLLCPQEDGTMQLSLWQPFVSQPK